MLDCASKSVLIDKLESGEYGYPKTNHAVALDIIEEARNILADDYNNFMNEARERIFNSVLDIATDAKLMGDRTNALNALKYLGTLFKLEEHNVNIKADVNEKVTINFGLDNGTES